MALREYQQKAVQAVFNEWEQGRNRTLLVQATGTGKTIVLADVVRRIVEQGGRALVMAHRSELLDQAADKIERTTGLKCSVEKAEETCVGSFFPVTVGSVQTLYREKRLEKIGRNRFDLVVIDEAHHAAAETYRRVLDFFSDAKVLGVTATPDRKGLGDIFDSVAFEYGLANAVRDGWLVPIEAQTIPREFDLRGARRQSGDYAAEDVASALDPFLDQIAEEMIAAGCKEKKTVCFLPLVATSKHFRDILENHGFKAAEVNGSSEDRVEVLADFDAGQYDVLCNAMLLTEGWDCPRVECVIPLRATQSRPLYAQMVGRGTRPSPETGKTHLLLLDFLWQTETHSLVKPAQLLCSDDEVAQKMTELQEAAGGPMDLIKLEQQATKDVIQERENSLAKKLQEMRTRKRKVVDPLQYAISIEASDLVDYKPEFAWQKHAPTKPQLDYLNRFGIDTEGVLDAGMASLLINHMSERMKMHLATPKMIRQLESRGFKRVGLWSFDDAHKMIGRIAANNWRVPYDIDPATYDPTSKEVAQIA